MLKDYPDKKHPKLKERGRKGCPNSLSGFTWCLLTDANTSGHVIKGRKGSIHGTAMDQNMKGETAKLMENLMKEDGVEHILYDIHKDVSRTLPNHIYFQERFSAGQNDLFAVLKCLSIVEPEVGYV